MDERSNLISVTLSLEVGAGATQAAQKGGSIEIFPVNFPVLTDVLLCSAVTLEMELSHQTRAEVQVCFQVWWSLR